MRRQYEFVFGDSESNDEEGLNQRQKRSANKKIKLMEKKDMYTLNEDDPKEMTGEEAARLIKHSKNNKGVEEILKEFSERWSDCGPLLHVVIGLLKDLPSNPSRCIGMWNDIEIPYMVLNCAVRMNSNLPTQDLFRLSSDAISRFVGHEELIISALEILKNIAEESKEMLEQQHTLKQVVVVMDAYPNVAIVQSLAIQLFCIASRISAPLRDYILKNCLFRVKRAFRFKSATVYSYTTHLYKNLFSECRQEMTQKIFELKLDLDIANMLILGINPTDVKAGADVLQNIVKLSSGESANFILTKLKQNCGEPGFAESVMSLLTALVNHQMRDGDIQRSLCITTLMDFKVANKGTEVEKKCMVMLDKYNKQ
ncbi:ribosomal RNA large subunit methyltransferase H [Acrasis kona]|uniref:Ribosomal RNA large subunit methyltransferase H n=1 Tax=Acrasis kona TaxID=1008807 RepID=A0AAW2ZQA3_9EUKA